MPFEKKKAQLRTSLILSLITAVLLAAISLCAWFIVKDYKEQALSLIQDTKNQELEKHKRLIQDRVKTILGLIASEKRQAEKRLKERINERVNEAYSLVRGVYKQMHGKYSDEEVRQACVEVLRTIRWDDGHGYFFIDSLQGEVVLFPIAPELEGTNILKNGSPNQKKIMSKIVSKANREGIGFVEYLSHRINDDRYVGRKLAYIRVFEPLGWILGTGAFPVDEMSALKTEILETISKINTEKDIDSYFFVIDLSEGSEENYGKLLLTRNSVVGEGQFISRGFNDVNGFPLLDEALEEINAHGESYVSYTIKKPSTGQSEARISYFKVYENWDWMIGTGFYLDEIRAAYAARAEQIKNDADRKVLYSILALGMMLFISVITIIAVAIQRGKTVEDRQMIVQQLLDSQKNIVFLTNGKDLMACNRLLLRTVNFPTLEQFREKHDCICELFQTADGFLPSDKGVWIDEVGKAEAKGGIAKALLFDNLKKAKRIFMVRIGDEIVEDEYVAVSLTDITESEKIKVELDRYIQIVDEFVQTSSTDIDGKITYVSKALCDATGFSENELLGENHRILRHPDMPHALFKEMWDTIVQGKTWHGDVLNKRKDGGECWTEAFISPVLDELGEHVGYTAIRHDISDKKKIEDMTVTDVMTGMPNRRFFNITLEREVNRAKRGEHNLAFLMIDVDHFKQYNDTYGHQAGDEALISVGQVMLDLFRRSTEYCFRLGGEEFGVLLCGVNPFEAHRVAEKLRENIVKKRIEHAGNPPMKYLTVSVGVAVCHIDRSFSQDELMALADKALYEAKADGRNLVVMKEKDLS